MQIVSRSQWGARPPKSRITGDTVRETFLHHSAGPHQGAAGVRSIQNYHMDRQGWADIAYNFLIDPHDFRVYEGRGWGVRPGSQKSYNTGTWSVCVLGNFQTRQPTQGLLDVIANLIRTGHQLGHIPLVLTGGHKDAPGQATSCPGQLLHSRIPDIRNLLESDMASPAQKMMVDLAFNLFPEEVGGDPNYWLNLDENNPEWNTAFRPALSKGAQNLYKRSKFSAGAHDHDGRYVKNIVVGR